MGEPLFFINRKHTYCGGPWLFHYISDNSLEITLVSLETQNNSLKPITTFLEIKMHWIYYLVAEFYEDQILALLYSVSWCSTQELARQNKSLYRYYIMGSFILNLSLKDNWKKKILLWLFHTKTSHIYLTEEIPDPQEAGHWESLKDIKSVCSVLVLDI